MADNENAKFIVDVETSYKKGDGAKTAKELQGDVLNVIKDGYIEVPVKIKAPIKGASKELKQAQQDVLTQWDKTFGKGFSSSSEDMDILIKKYRKFKTLAKGKLGEDQTKWITDNIGKQIAAYNKELKKIQEATTMIAPKQVKTSTKTEPNKAVQNKTSQKYNPSVSPKSVADIDDESMKEFAKRMNGLASVLPQGYKVGWVDPGKTNDIEAGNSESSFYGTNWERQMAQSLKEAYPEAAKSLVTYIDKELAKAESGEKEIDRTGLLNTLSKKSLNGLSSLIRQKEAGKDVPLTRFVDQIGIIKSINDELGKDLSETFTAIGKKLVAPYSDNSKRKIGGTAREEGTEKGVGPGHEATTETLKVLNEILNKVWDVTPTVESMRKQIYKDSVDEKRATKSSNKKSSKGSSEKNTQYEKNISTFRGTDSYKELQNIANIGDTVVNSLSGITNNTKATSDKVKEVNATETKQNAGDAIDYTREQMEATKLQDIESENATTGTDSEHGKNEVIDAIQNQKNKSSTKEETPDLTTTLKEFSTLLTEALGKISGTTVSSKTGGINLADAMCPCQDILSQIAQSAKNLEVSVGNIVQELVSMGAKLPNNLPALIEGEGVRDIPIEKEPIIDKTDHRKLNAEYNKKLEEDRSKERTGEWVHASVQKYLNEKHAKEAKDAETAQKEKQLSDAKIPLSEVIASSFKSPSVLDSIKEAFSVASKTGPNAEQILGMNQVKLEKLRAERISKFGLTKEDKAGATGDYGTAYRRKSVYGWDKQGNSNPFKDLKLSDSLKIDTTDITRSLQDVIEKNQFNAQTGGVMRNIIGSMTGYLGMPSLEKTRSQADGLNSVMAEIRKAAQDILNTIQSKETDLRSLQSKGKAVFNDDGTMNAEASTKEAVSLFGNLEEQKMALRGVLADAAAVDQVVQATGGNVNQILQQLGFASPELRKCNTIIQNLNAGLDKSGKALKAQTRTAEVLNYTFQLMARSVGQMIKRWLLMLNPISLIKRAFQDFASYDTKWQRTMNVIKYNLRRIIKPAMQWIAQQIVNIIGLVNALIKGIGKVFGKNWDLFDQAAANTEKMDEEAGKTKEKLEQASASFDELHDISNNDKEDDNNNPNDPDNLLGDIYTPQWEGLYDWIEKVGEKIGNLIKMVKGWTFWDWLKLAGLALVGFLALRALINWFRKGKNPLQTVADGFKTLEKTVGWATLIWAFSQFVKALTDFVECMKTASWEDIIKTLLTLAGAFDILVGSIVIMMEVAKKTGTNAGQLFGLAALVGVFDAFVMALIPFLKMVKELEETGKEWEILGEAALTLVSAFAIMVGAVWAIQKTLAKGMDWSSLLGLSAVVLVFSAFTDALIPFINCIKDLGEERFDVIITAIVGLVGAFLSLALGVGVITQAFKTMDWSSVGKLATLVGVFTLFTYALIPFINAVKDIPADELMIKLAGLAAVFIALGLAIGVMSVAMQSISWTAVAGMAVALLGMAAITWTLSELAKALKDLSEGQIYAGLMLLAGGLLAIAVAIGVLAIIFTAVVTTGIGALAVLLLALILGMVALIIEAMADFVTALGEAGAGIQLICEGIATIIDSIGTTIMGIVQTVADGIATVITAIAQGITDVLTPIMEFMGTVMETIGELAGVVAHEIGETIRTIIETVGTIISNIITGILESIPKLSDAILKFIGGIGPAIDKTVTSIMKTVTKLVNFMVSAIEYLINLAVDGVNGVVDAINGLSQYVGITLPRAHTVSIRRFVPKYELGTNYVPNDGLAYLHEGEAVIPKKYNTPYQPGMSDEEKLYMKQMISVMNALDGTIKEGITVNGQFTQKGSDLVAVVNKTRSQSGADLISNVAYAR